MRWVSKLGLFNDGDWSKRAEESQRQARRNSSPLAQPYATFTDYLFDLYSGISKP